MFKLSGAELGGFMSGLENGMKFQSDMAEKQADLQKKQLDLNNLKAEMARARDAAGASMYALANAGHQDWLDAQGDQPQQGPYDVSQGGQQQGGGSPAPAIIQGFKVGAGGLLGGAGGPQVATPNGPQMMPPQQRPMPQGYGGPQQGIVPGYGGQPQGVMPQGYAGTPQVGTPGGPQMVPQRLPPPGYGGQPQGGGSGVVPAGYGGAVPQNGVPPQGGGPGPQMQPQQMPTGIPPGGLTIQQAAAMIDRKYPGMDPQTKLMALNQLLPLLGQDGKMALQLQKQNDYLQIQSEKIQNAYQMLMMKIDSAKDITMLRSALTAGRESEPRNQYFLDKNGNMMVGNDRGDPNVRPVGGTSPGMTRLSSTPLKDPNESPAAIKNREQLGAYDNAIGTIDDIVKKVTSGSVSAGGSAAVARGVETLTGPLGGDQSNRIVGDQVDQIRAQVGQLARRGYLSKAAQEQISGLIQKPGFGTNQQRFLASMAAVRRRLVAESNPLRQQASPSGVGTQSTPSGWSIQPVQ